MTTGDPLRVGLIGAGSWARDVIGPTLAAGPETRLTGVWSRTAAHAADAAAAIGVRPFDDLDTLLDTCDAVAIEVAPVAQPDLAVRAAHAGKTLMLDKPLACDVAGAQRIADAVEESGVASLIVLSYRFHPDLPAFLDAARDFGAFGGRGAFLSGAFLAGSPFAHGWRLERGVVLDVGPHQLDLHEAALGDVVEVRAAGDVHGWVSAVLQHESGATSELSLCSRVGGASRTELDLHGPSGTLRFDGRDGDPSERFVNLRRTLATVANGEPHVADVARGLHLQRLIADIESQLSA